MRCGNDSVKVPAEFIDTPSGGKNSFKCTLDTGNLPVGDNETAIILTTNSPLRPVISLYIAGTIYQ